jgi:hypothetical protein
MKSLKFLASVSVVLLLTLFVVPVGYALPQTGVYNTYYDADWNQIGEKDISCDGGRYVEGQTLYAAHVSGYSLPCAGGDYTYFCEYWDYGVGGYVYVDLSYCGF